MSADLLPYLTSLPRSFFDRRACEVAPDVLGAYLVRYSDRDWELPSMVGRIVEAEAYEQTDPASHSFRGKTERTRSMFGPPGHAYVYLIYGMHFCFNLVCEKAGIGSAVLIRAVEPVLGEKEMRDRRAKARRPKDLTNGPAKLAQAFGITRKRDDGSDLLTGTLRICVDRRESGKRPVIRRSKRIGISKATELEWRYFVENNEFVSR